MPTLFFRFSAFPVICKREHVRVKTDVVCYLLCLIRAEQVHLAQDPIHPLERDYGKKLLFPRLNNLTYIPI
jgi:hypothetical protein